MDLLHLVKLLRLYKLTNTQIYQINLLRENKDIQLHQNPTSDDADDDFGFNETVSFFQDAKNFDEESGTDKLNQD